MHVYNTGLNSMECFECAYLSEVLRDFRGVIGVHRCPVGFSGKTTLFPGDAHRTTQHTQVILQSQQKNIPLIETTH